MASNATLTIKVGANVKDAAQQLQALGYNIESVKKKTDKANDSASLWSQTMKKGSEDSVRKLVEMGAKFLTVSTVITGVYRGIKSCVSEALKENEEAQKKIDAINTAWTGVQKNLGNALLDSITPALDALYKMLLKIEEWSKTATQNASFNKMTSEFENQWNAGTVVYDLSAYSVEQLKDYYSRMHELVDMTYSGGWWTGEGDDPQTTQQYRFLRVAIQEEIEAREKAADEINQIAEDAKNASSSSSSSSTETPLWQQALKYSAKYNNEIKAGQLQKLLDEAKSHAETPGEDILGFYADAAENLQKEIDALAEETSISWQDAFSEIYSSAKSCFSGVFSFMDAYYDRQIKNIEDSEASEEEKNAKINELEKKQFEAQQANSYANATISFAEGMIDIWSKYGASPWIGAALTALLTANTGLQFATISQQTYTPSLAEGGIVTSPTHAFIGEGAEHEAVIPLSKLEDFVNRDSEGGAIYLNITCNGNSSEADVFRAIERAQRTGLLPHWRYA